MNTRSTLRKWGDLPVPWFVQWYDGKPDFRVVDTAKMLKADRHKLCMICGEPLGKFASFVIGPMCCVNRVSSEPPSHRDCAREAVKVCPFLSDPDRVRREAEARGPTMAPAGLVIERNPGVSAIWTTRSWERFWADFGNVGYLWRLGTPEDVSWWCRGREATRQEVTVAVNSGLPALYGLATAQSEASVEDLNKAVAAFDPLLPAEAS